MMHVQKGKNGIECAGMTASVVLDPKNAAGSISFTSHAHTDHLPSPKSSGTVLCTKETAELAVVRGRAIQNSVQSYEGMQMVDSGHVFGGRGLLFEDAFYTGDICTRDRPGMRGAKVPKCKTLITECTFGRPEFRFPAIDEVAEEANGAVSEMYSRGTPVVLMGYELGKAQTICRMFSHWKPFFCHERVKRINDVCRSFGSDVPDSASFQEAEESGAVGSGPWVMVSPVLAASDPFLKRLKSEYGAVTMGFSGWSILSHHPLARRCDRMFAYSDHCDYAELLQMVADSGADTVYTMHGYAEEFARDVRDKIGTSAQSLEGAIKCP